MLPYVLLLLWVLYLLAPIDLFPDVIPGIGRIDDLILLAILYWTQFRKRKGATQGGPAGGGGGGSSSGTGYGSRGGTSDYGSGARYERSSQTQGAKLKDPYKILGVDRSASMEDIKHAYRTQAAKYHPDKVSHLGAEFQALAKEKFQDIQWAYEKLKAARGA